MTNQTHTAQRSCWTTLAIALAIAIVTIAFLYSMLDAQELPDPAGPVVIPTPTMLPAPTPDGDDFPIMWHVVYLPIVEASLALFFTLSFLVSMTIRGHL